MTDLLIVAPDRTWPPDFWDQIAALHQSEIPGGFLSSLNRGFLARLYAAVARSDKAFIFAAINVETRKVAGFIGGSTDPGGMMRDCILQSGFRLIFPVLRELSSWRTVVRIFETMKYTGGRGNQSFPQAEILNFCVGANFQRSGVGRCLFGSLVSEFKRRGIERIKIVTGESQTSAQRFYEAVRARRAGDENIHGVARSIVFVYEIG